MAKLGNICEIGFATMGSGVRTSPGPPIFFRLVRSSAPRRQQMVKEQEAFSLTTFV